MSMFFSDKAGLLIEELAARALEGRIRNIMLLQDAGEPDAAIARTIGCTARFVRDVFYARWQIAGERFLAREGLLPPRRPQDPERWFRALTEVCHKEMAHV